MAERKPPRLNDVGKGLAILALTGVATVYLLLTRVAIGNRDTESSVAEALMLGGFTVAAVVSALLIAAAPANTLVAPVAGMAIVVGFMLMQDATSFGNPDSPFDGIQAAFACALLLSPAVLSRWRRRHGR